MPFPPKANGLFYNSLPPESIYNATPTALEQPFTPKMTVCEERQSLRKRYQFPEEPVDRYVAALSEMAPNCAFGPLENEMVRDQPIEGISSEGIRERLLSIPDFTLEKPLTASQQMEIAKKDAALFSIPDLTAAVQSTESTSFSSFRGTGDLLRPTPPCFRCGRASHLASCSNCHAKHARCRKRDKLGHFAQVCGSVKPSSQHEVVHSVSAVCFTDIRRYHIKTQC
ncbi:hypothetical protein M513_13966 [Trichuris suis]|uniref:Uncharacterized protein n=1 Tax=Trichuris suis TaxID=68888 RepID=A0A085LJL0_9BILA|nr:hypothetical protein M513_13966 [Trichuris suis]